jgi:hypothetical protein
MYKFQCKHKYEEGNEERWTGSWDVLEIKPDYFELLIRGRGSEFCAVFGSSTMGDYLCIPSMSVGCSLSCSSDLFWNTEQIARVLNITDAVTIANAFFEYEKSQIPF